MSPCRFCSREKKMSGAPCRVNLAAGGSVTEDEPYPVNLSKAVPWTAAEQQSFHGERPPCRLELLKEGGPLPVRVR